MLRRMQRQKLRPSPLLSLFTLTVRQVLPAWLIKCSNTASVLGRGLNRLFGRLFGLIQISTIPFGLRRNRQPSGICLRPCVPTIIGKSYSRATIAVWLNQPPISQTNPPICRNCGTPCGVYHRAYDDLILAKIGDGAATFRNQRW